MDRVIAIAKEGWDPDRRDRTEAGDRDELQEPATTVVSGMGIAVSDLYGGLDILHGDDPFLLAVTISS